MKKISIILTALLIALFMVFAMGSSEDKNETSDQGSGSVEATKAPEDKTSLGDYSVVIDSCRLAKDYEGKDVIIVKYIFSNVSNEESISFMVALSDKVFQNGIGLESAIVTDDSANYDSGNQMKDIKKGATLEVEAAYVLENTTDNVDVEVSELISFSDKKITKTFTIA